LLDVYRDPETHYSPPAVYGLSKYRIDCENDTSTMLFVTVYTENGVPADSTIPVEATRPNIPGSIQESVEQFVCGKKAIEPARTMESLAAARDFAGTLLHLQKSP
jgi:hypothetical protein